MNRKRALLISVLFWGGGQFFVCRQRAKGLLFFAAQLLLIGMEAFSGYWPEWAAGRIPHFSVRLHGGFFTKGLWGMITLGQKEGGPNGDYSTMLLVQGVVAMLVLGVFLLVGVWNVRDAWSTGKEIDETGTCLSSTAYFKRLYKRRFPYFVLAPIAFVFLLVVLMPIIFTFLTAFLNYNRSNLPPGHLLDWIGLDNFRKLLTVPVWSQTFYRVLLWTVVWALVTTISTFTLGLLQALILNHPAVRFKRLFRTILILPWAVPQMVTLLVFQNLLNAQFGPVNRYLMEWGWIRENIYFLSDPIIAKITVLVVFLWLGFSMFMVMLLGILSNLDPTLYEAASIDGASRMQAFRRVTLPLVLRAVMPPLIMSFAANFNAFGPIYFLTKGGPADSSLQFAGGTDILISWIYKLTLDQQMYNMAAVMSILLFAMVGAFSYWNFRRTEAYKEL